RRAADPLGRRCAVRAAGRHVRRRGRAAAVLRAALRRPAAGNRRVDGRPLLARPERRRDQWTTVGIWNEEFGIWNAGDEPIGLEYEFQIPNSKFLIARISDMGVIKGLFNAVADPRLFFLLAVAALAVVVWKRESIAANAVGYGVLGFLGVF